MRIQHNISALNAHRQLGINNSAVSKNLEKLSSGFRINRAGDDAAGLAISEKMRGQIRGLDMATRNAQDGVSLIQTAEGALQETHSILQRMRELSVQASNGTYEEGFDSKQINKEVTHLKAEIDRIADSTHFNNQKLLNGDLSAAGGSTAVKYETNSAIAAGTEVAATAGVFKNGTAIDKGTDGKNTALQIDYRDADGSMKTLTVTAKAGTAVADTSANVLAELQKTELAEQFDITNAAGVFTFTAKEKGKTQFEILAMKQDVDTTDSTGFVAAGGTMSNVAGRDNAHVVNVAGADVASTTLNNKFEIDGQKFQIVELGQDADEGYNAITVGTGKLDGSLADQDSIIVKQLKDYGIDAEVSTTANAGAATAGSIVIKKATGDKKGEGLTFQIGANGTADDRVSLAVANQDTTTLGIAGIDLSNQDGANQAITLLDNAINSVSSTRADLGALQNRLEHTINNLGTSVENLTASESRIRDVDMAKEMMEMTKNNILTQAAQAMLAQANTQPQGVLQLLQ